MGCTACFSFSFDGDLEVKRVPEVAGGDGPAGAFMGDFDGHTVHWGFVGHAKLPGEKEAALRRAHESVGHGWLANISCFSCMVWLARASWFSSDRWLAKSPWFSYRRWLAPLHWFSLL